MPQKTHYRLFDTWPLPEEQELDYGAVAVGQYDGKTVVHVNCAAAEYEGPGAFSDETLDEMNTNHPSIYEQVAEAAVEETDAEGNTVLRRRKIGGVPSDVKDDLGPDFDHPKIPDHVKVHDTNLVPHTFAGVDHY